MNNSQINSLQVSYLRTSREFPEDLKQLAIETNRAYLDIANSVNNRTIGTFPVNRSVITGENWFITQNKRQQGLRQTYKFDDTMAVAGVITIPHGINIKSLTNFVRIWGTFFDGIFWDTLPFVARINAADQITLKVNATNIVITKGAGAPPAIMNGLVTLEWISNP